jgi:hypothetical protein
VVLARFTPPRQARELLEDGTEAERTMRTLVDFYEIQPRGFESARSALITIVDLEIIFEEPEQGPGLPGESLSRARNWCEE